MKDKGVYLVIKKKENEFSELLYLKKNRIYSMAEFEKAVYQLLQ